MKRLYSLYFRFFSFSVFFFFNDTATTEIYTLSLHDALPICKPINNPRGEFVNYFRSEGDVDPTDRKSTRLNSSHSQISYAVFCLKKKKQKNNHPEQYQFPNLSHQIDCQILTPTTATSEYTLL